MSHKNQAPKRLQWGRDFLQQKLLGRFGFLTIDCKSISHYLKNRIQALRDDNTLPDTYTVLAQLVFWSGTSAQCFFGTDYAPHTYRAAQRVKQVAVMFKCSW